MPTVYSVTRTVRKQTCTWCLQNWLDDHHTAQIGREDAESLRTICWAILMDDAPKGRFFLCAQHLALFENNPEPFLAKKWPNVNCAECGNPVRDDYLCRQCREGMC